MYIDNLEFIIPKDGSISMELSLWLLRLATNRNNVSPLGGCREASLLLVAPLT